VVVAEQNLSALLPADLGEKDRYQSFFSLTFEKKQKKMDRTQKTFKEK